MAEDFILTGDRRRGRPVSQWFDFSTLSIEEPNEREETRVRAWKPWHRRQRGEAPRFSAAVQHADGAPNAAKLQKSQGI